MGGMEGWRLLVEEGRNGLVGWRFIRVGGNELRGAGVKVVRRRGEVVGVVCGRVAFK